MDELQTTLKCGKCKKNKPDDDFPLRTTAAKNRRGRDFKCRECKHSYYEQNRETMLAQTRAANIRREYGITADEYDRLVAMGCSACGTNERRVVLDHCHATGKVRGPLCDRCNGILGRAKDSPELLRALADYLENNHE